MATSARSVLGLSGQVARLSAQGAWRDTRAALRDRAAARRVPPAHLTRFDPFRPAVLADPYPAYRELLAGPRAQYNERRRLWILSRHADVHAAARAHATLSSAEG